MKTKIALLIVAARPIVARTIAKIINKPPSTHSSFLRKQESHSHVRQQCQIRPHTSVHPQLIPAKAGISKGNALPPPHLATRHCEIPAFAGMVPGKTGVYRPKIRPIVARTIANIAADSHSPHRPFLRKQESHSNVRQQCQIRPHTSVPPLDHSCVGRNLKGQRPSPPHLATRYCEIPAFAGMVYGEWESGANLAIVGDTTL